MYISMCVCVCVYICRCVCVCMYGQNIDKPYSLKSIMKASGLPCQASIEYWCIPTTFSLYISIFESCELEMMHTRNWQDCPPKQN